MNGPCREMQEKIADDVLGALDVQQRQVVRKHLAECPQCRAYAEALQQQSEALTALGNEVKTDMAARQERVIQIFDVAAPAQERSPWFRRLVPLTVAALLVLGVGITIGRLTAPKPIDVEQLRAALQRALAASLQPAVRETVRADVNQQLESALSAGETRLKAEIVELVREDLRTFATDVVAGSEEMMDQRFADFVQLIQAARLNDPQRVARAFEYVESNRRRDKTPIGQGLQSLATLTKPSPTTTDNIPPSITLISPMEGAEFTAGMPMALRAEASDPDGDVIRVRYNLTSRSENGVSVTGARATDPTDNWKVSWDGWSRVVIAPDRTYTIQAEAMDDQGAKTLTPEVEIKLDQ